MELLLYIGERSPISVRDVAAHFEKEKGLARTTILTVMERLRTKGFLSRQKLDGIFKYSAKMEAGAVLSDKISDFVEKTLGGSVSPLLNYFSNSKLSNQEIEQLRAIAARLGKDGK
jgi:predicted transcriptional regulator